MRSCLKESIIFRWKLAAHIIYLTRSNRFLQNMDHCTCMIDSIWQVCPLSHADTPEKFIQSEALARLWAFQISLHRWRKLCSEIFCFTSVQALRKRL